MVKYLKVVPSRGTHHKKRLAIFLERHANALGYDLRVVQWELLLQKRIPVGGALHIARSLVEARLARCPCTEVVEECT